VPGDHPEPREPVEDAGDHHPQQFDAGVVVPTDAMGRECRVRQRVEPVVVGGSNRCRQRLRVQVERCVERLGRFEDRPEEGLVEMAIASPTEHHRTVEAEGRYGAFQLGGGAFGRRGGQRGQPLESIRMGANRQSESVVGLCLQRDGLLRRQVLHAWCRQREDLDVDADLVHRREALRSEVAELAPTAAVA
jgi:hypothetical protein